MSRGGEFGGLWGRRRSRQGGHLLCHDQLWGLDWLRATAPLRALAVSSVLFLLPGVVIQIKSSQVDAHKKVFFSCCWRFTHIRVSQDTRGRRNRGGSGKRRNLGGRWGVTSPRSSGTRCPWRVHGARASLDLGASVGGPCEGPAHLLVGGLWTPSLEGQVRLTLIDSLPAARLPSLLVLKQQST